MLKIIILCLLSVFVPLQIEASEQLKLTGAVQTIGIQDNLDTLRVLFVGNSYTYFWGLAQLVEGLSRNGDRYIYTRTSTASGASLNDHWHGRFDLKTIEKIVNGDWDVVVLQNQSRSSIDSLDQFLRYGKKLIQLIRNADAIPLIFETWAPKRDPFMQELITSAHDELASETNTKKIPIGTLWEKVKELNPGLDLYDPDGSHPNSTGTYFNACVFYAFFTGEKASYLDSRVQTIDHHGDSVQLSVQDDQDALFLQSIIDTYLIQTLGEQ
jgi:lysophospholipase L1-like esterase